MKKQVTEQHIAFLKSVVDLHRREFFNKADVWAYAEYGKALKEYNDALESRGNGVPDMFIAYGQTV